MNPFVSLLRLLVLLLALGAAPVVAQPSADALLNAWLDNWDAASERLDSVGMTETHVRTVEGPRGTLEIETVGTIRLFPGQRPQRSVVRVSINGEPFELAKRDDMEERLRHALGQTSMDLRRPAPLPIRVLASAEPEGSVQSTRLGSTSAWQISLLRPSRRGPPEHLTAWFTRSRTAPRLLRLQRDRRLRHQDTLTRVTTYTRVDGLDLPVSHTVDAEIEQRRRLRTYTLVIHSTATYDAPLIELK